MSQSQSQLDPLPGDIPFRIISKTIGRGAYASIKKAIPLDADTPIFAVKFIHKCYAIKHGRISAKQIAMEVSLHSHIGQHPNIIEWFATGEDAVWRWIAMEFADGGDLFDKIEADMGVHEDIAHLYFGQLIGGVSFMHSKGVAHRDLKPENILLSDTGDLKIADFGMATLFSHKGHNKVSTTMCGSPPYIAPEVLSAGKRLPSGSKSTYSADQVDIWSCGVILFVLLVGNTPWDEPTPGSWEFQEYIKTNGRSSDPLWSRVPTTAHSLLRGMMSVDPSKRFSFAQIRQHPWYTRRNPLLSTEGKVSDPLNLATQLLSNLRIDLSQKTTPSSQPTPMDIDSASQPSLPSHLALTQPETPITDALFDWEHPTTTRPSLLSATQPSVVPPHQISSTQPATAAALQSYLSEDPSQSQFSSTPGLPLTLTQHARRFRDIVPSYSLTRFYSAVPPQLLVQMLSDALHGLNVPLPPIVAAGQGNAVGRIKVRTLDGRRQGLHGDIFVDKIHLAGGEELLEVRFVKVKGDPLEWRRFFKKVALLCRDAVWREEEQEGGM
ncbi:kinase-like domain-containing protein [Coniochaeta sp. 2T2.1]|nr:kinase-like domain-containing protein [Coniochaeta sp. 2T2.1]